MCKKQLFANIFEEEKKKKNTASGVKLCHYSIFAWISQNYWVSFQNTLSQFGTHSNWNEDESEYYTCLPKRCFISFHFNTPCSLVCHFYLFLFSVISLDILHFFPDLVIILILTNTLQTLISIVYSISCILWQENDRCIAWFLVRKKIFQVKREKTFSVW